MMFPESGQLVVRFGDTVLQTVPLTLPVLTIGRNPGNGLVLRDPTISGYHAVLRIELDGAIVIDRDSRNGTVVDGVALPPNQPYALADGSAVEIGPYILTYQGPRLPVRRIEEPDEVAPDRAPEEAPAPVVAPTVAPGRSTYPMDPSTRAASSYVRNLPVIFQDDPQNTFLQRYLLIFESIWEPLEQRQDHIAMYFDPRTCPRSFLPWLASWLGFPLPPQWPEPRTRAVLREAMDLYRWRGTRYGLERLIEVCTGLRPEVTEDAERPFVVRVSVAAPPGAVVDRDLIEALIQTHKPAHAGYILDIAS